MKGKGFAGAMLAWVMVTGSLVAPVVAQTTTVGATVSTIAAGNHVTVAWGDIATPRGGDWIGLYRTGTTDGTENRIRWTYTTGTASGSLAFLISPFDAPGSYDFRLFSDNSLDRLAISPALAVTAPNVSVVAAETTIEADRYLSASWSGNNTPDGGDWIGLFALGVPNDGPRVTWAYTGGTTAGTLSLPVEPNVGPGQFELRLFSANSLLLLGRSAPITVGRPRLAIAPSLTSFSADRAITVSWSGTHTFASSGDWISLFAVGVPDNGPRIDWTYTGGAPSGSLSFGIRPNVPPGQYEFRMFWANGLTLLGKSEVIIIGPPTVPLSVVPPTWGPGDLVQVSWRDHLYANGGDWIGLYPAGSTDSTSNRISWRYTTGTSVGTVDFAVPASLSPAVRYELRMFWANGLQRLDGIPTDPSPANRAPVVTAGADVRQAGGGWFEGSVDFSDPDSGQTWTADVDYGDGGGVRALTIDDRHIQLRNRFAIGGPYTVVVRVRDSAGGVGSGIFRVTIDNAVPLVNVGQSAGAFVRTPFVRSGTFVDPDQGQTWTATVDYGDGTGTRALPLGAGIFELRHSYERPGAYRVLVAVTDDLGGSGEARLDITVSPARAFIFVHGLGGSHVEDSFAPLIRRLQSEYAGEGQVYRFQYWQDIGDRPPGSTTRECGPDARSGFEPNTPSFGLPLTTSPRGLTAAICDSQSDVGINAVLLEREVRRMHERFGGRVTLIANSLGGAITRAYLAYAQASDSPTLGYVDLVVFLQAAHQGSYLTLARPEISASTSPLGYLAVVALGEAVRARLGYDPNSPAFEDLRPLSDTYRWVNLDPAHVPNGIAYLNVASAIDVTVEANIFGYRWVIDRLSLGDVALLPGADSPTALPLLGGARFDPRVIARGGPGTDQVILRRDVPVGIELLAPLGDGGLPALLDSLQFPEWHGAFGERMGEITVPEDGRRVDQFILDRIREAGR